MGDRVRGRREDLVHAYEALLGEASSNPTPLVLEAVRKFREEILPQAGIRVRR